MSCVNIARPGSIDDVENFHLQGSLFQHRYANVAWKLAAQDKDLAFFIKERERLPQQLQDYTSQIVANVALGVELAPREDVRNAYKHIYDQVIRGMTENE